MHPISSDPTQPVIGLTYKARRDDSQKDEIVVYQGVIGGHIVVADKDNIHYRAKRDSGITSQPKFLFLSEDLA